MGKFNVNEIREIRTKTNVFFGVGAIYKIADILAELKKMNISKVLVVAGRSSYKSSGAWEVVEPALKQGVFEYALYNGVTPNPTVEQCDEATAIGMSIGAQAVIGIGGGSPIDAAKTAAILLSNTERTAREIFEYTFTPEKAVPIIAINITHGTGTEVDRVAVVNIPEKDYKPDIAYDVIYPLYSIDDPALTLTLPKEQISYVSVDAVNHVVEAATSKVSSPYSITLAEETVRLIAEYLPKALENPQDVEARYYLLYASMIAGVSFDNGLLHFTHALQHPLSAVNQEFSHGLGLGILLPEVVREIYASQSEVLASVLGPITEGLKGTPDEADKAAEGVKKWLKSVGITTTLKDEGFKDEDVPKLVNLAFETPGLGFLLSIAPIEATREVVERIYRNSL